MNFATVRLLAVAAVAAAAAWAWQANRYDKTIAQMQRDHAIERQAAVDTVVTALQAAIDKHRQLTDQLDALDRTHFSEMQRATAENTRLQRAFATGDVRMIACSNWRVVKCPAHRVLARPTAVQLEPRTRHGFSVAPKLVLNGNSQGSRSQGSFVRWKRK